LYTPEKSVALQVVRASVVVVEVVAIVEVDVVVVVVETRA